MKSNSIGKTGKSQSDVADVVPQGLLKRLKVSDIKASTNNPRQLFDKMPLKDLKENIRLHGVLVPITVFEVKGQKKYAILDGERRYRCCVELENEGKSITIPANIVEPPTRLANMLYMFSIHNFREAWELMPTALSLEVVMNELDEKDTKRLTRITGLSEPQIERCKILLEFPKQYQDMSLHPDPKARIPSNFWIEAWPILEICKESLPLLYKKLGRNGITDKLVEKYRDKKIKSVLHFRRIVEAYEISADDQEQRRAILERLTEYITDVSLETRMAFDEFVVDNRRVQSTVKACGDFMSQLQRAKLEHTLDRDELMMALRKVNEYIDSLLRKLEGADEPPLVDDSEE